MNFSRFHTLPSILAGTAVVASVVISKPVMAKTAREVAKIAVPTTVQIDNTLNTDSGGSGVIIAKEGNLYTVLTANHVVVSRAQEYTIMTSKGTEYLAIPESIQGFQDADLGPDLAIVQFKSDQEYAVAPLSNSDEATIGSGVYISGYAMSVEPGEEREYAFTSGQVTNRRRRDDKGYTMRYDAVTRRGMSGGPVFDVNGRVIGIHGEGDVEKGIASENAAGEELRVKTGLNQAVPINTFVSLIEQVEISKDLLNFDNSPLDDVDAEKVSQKDVNNWYNEYRVITDVLRFLPIPGIPGVPSFFGW